MHPVHGSRPDPLAGEGGVGGGGAGSLRIQPAPHSVSRSHQESRLYHRWVKVLLSCVFSGFSLMMRISSELPTCFTFLYREIGDRFYIFM